MRLGEKIQLCMGQSINAVLQGDCPSKSSFTIIRMGHIVGCVNPLPAPTPSLLNDPLISANFETLTKCGTRLPSSISTHTLSLSLNRPFDCYQQVTCPY